MGHADLPIVPPSEQSLSHVDALEVGTRLGDYELQGLLGVGGFGMVYRAHDRNLQRAVAIKEYMPSALAYRQDGLRAMVRSPSDAQAYADGLAAFGVEARLLARFDHPSLAKVLHFWEANGTAYMVMPLYKGITLKQARGLLEGPPPERWLRKVMWPILQVLKLLHEQHVLHRDISPDNILLQDMGPPILLDLGSARKAVSDRSQRHTAVLKVNYAPIEQYEQGEDLREGAWTDIYSLAAVIYGLVRNEPPQPATFRVVRDHMPSMVKMARTVQAHFGRHYSREFAVAIDRALRLRPADRPQSVTAFIEVLRLQPPDQLASFDWWCEVDESEAPVAPARRWPWWLMLARAAEQDLQTRQTLNAWRKTGQRDSVWQDFDLSRGDTRNQTSTLESVWQRAPSRAPRAPRRAGSYWAMAAVLASVLAGALLFRGADSGTAVSAATAPPVAGQPAASRPKQVAALPVVADKPVPQARQPRETTGVAPRVVQRSTPPPVARAPARSAPVVAAKRPEPRSRTVSTVELCADSNFFTRPMCLHRECQKPAFSKLPVCAETRAREQAAAQSTRL